MLTRSIRLTCLVLAALTCTFRAQAQGDVEPSPVETRAPASGAMSIALPGQWTVRTTMWSDAALVFYDKYAWWSLDGDERKPRRLYEYPEKAWSRASAPAWSRDGTRLFAWVNVGRQLTTIDVRSGDMRSITALPTHVFDLERHRHMDPSPVWRAGGVVEDPDTGLLLQLIEEESNEKVAFWQRSAERKGGHWLVAIDPATSEMSTLSIERAPDPVMDWDLSPRRQRVYELDVSQRLVERKLNGALVREFATPPRRPNSVALSPDENTLLVVCAKGEGVMAVTGDSGGGFLLVNLEDGSVREGATYGFKAAWCPDGRRVACLAPWTLFVHDVQSGEEQIIARRDPPPDGRPNPTYWERPVWSADGRRIVVGIGGRNDYPTVLVDLEAREVLVLPTYVKDALWCAVPRPFPQGFVPADS
jgi:hypothetical protein